MELNVLSPPEAVFWAAHAIHNAGVPRTSRTLEHREIQNVTLHIRYPHINAMTTPGRRANPTIGALEACQLVGQLGYPEGMTRRVPAFEPYLDGGLFWGSYGMRVNTQFTRAENLLREDEGTRQAVVSIYDGQRDLRARMEGLRGVRDVPCTLTLQFLWTPDHRLSLRVSMRSNDVFLGLPYDLFQFTALQCAMADALGVAPGPYVHTVGSLHAYLKDAERLEQLNFGGEPTAEEVFYPGFWRGHSFAEISERARDLLFGNQLIDETPFEAYLREALERTPTHR